MLKRILLTLLLIRLPSLRSLPLKHMLLACLLWLGSCIAPAYALIGLESSLRDLHYDAGSMELDLLQFDSSLRLLPTREGRLLVDHLRAERLVIRMKQAPAAEKPDQPAAPISLPDTIAIPFPLHVQEASIKEIEIITGQKRQLLRNVTLQMDADSQQIKLQLSHAETPWGEIKAQLDIANRKPYTLSGDVHVLNHGHQHTRQHTLPPLAAGTEGIPYTLHAQLSGNLQALRFEMHNQFVMQDGKPAFLAGPASRYSVSSAGVSSDSARNDVISNEDLGVNTQAASAVAGQLSIVGELGLEADMPLKLNIALAGFKPDAWGQDIRARLNLDLALDGNLMPAPQLKLSLKAHDSEWRGQALQAQAELQILDQLISGVSLQASLGKNQLQAQGSLGAADSQLLWQANLPALNALGAAFAGKLDASGSLKGEFSALEAEFKLLGENLRLPGNITARQLSGQGKLQAMGELSATLETQGLRLQQGSFVDGQVQLSGNRQQHQLSLSASGTGLKLDGQLSGGFDANGAWAGSLQSLNYQGDTPVTLAAPAAISHDAEHGLRIGQLALQFKQGRITLENLQQGPQGLSTQGSISKLALRDIPPALLALPANLKGNPVFSGGWDIQALETLNGTLQLQRESGDLSVVREGLPELALGLQQVALRLDMQDNRVQLKADIVGEKFGSVTAQASTEVSGSQGVFLLAASAPLQASLNADFASLAWLPLPDIQADGSLKLALKADGTLARPGLQGTVSGRQLAFALPAEGVKLSNGQLDIHLEDDRLILDTLRFTGGAGSISASGDMRLVAGNPAVSLDWVLDNFTAAQRTDRLLVLNGTASTRLRDNQLVLDGDLRVIRGLIELAGEGAPQLGDDVVIIGRERETEESPLQFTIGNLKINLGDEVIGIVDPGKQFLLRGRGLDGYLTGILTLSGAVPNNLRAEGSIRVGGTYMAYGQLLNIEKGIINFSGPIDNPGLNLTAMRDNQAVKAGVEITGNVMMPTVKLVSTPNVPDSDKLSWLVLGHGMDQAGKNEFAMLSLAAGALLSQGQSVPLQTRMARAAGLDSFSIGGSDVQSSSVNFGKRLSPKLYLSYEKSLTGLLNVAKLTYTISKRWSVVSQAGSESAVDVLYTFRFK